MASETNSTISHEAIRSEISATFLALKQQLPNELDEALALQARMIFALVHSAKQENQGPRWFSSVQLAEGEDPIPLVRPIAVIDGHVYTAFNKSKRKEKAQHREIVGDPILGGEDGAVKTAKYAWEHLEGGAYKKVVRLTVKQRAGEDTKRRRQKIQSAQNEVKIVSYLCRKLPRSARYSQPVHALFGEKERKKLMIFTRLYENGDLFSLLERFYAVEHGNLSREQRQDIFRYRGKTTLQLTENLAELHSACVVHGDIKPENIFVDANGEIAIGDFDQSIVLPEGAVHLEFPLTYIGTAVYCSPEVAKRLRVPLHQLFKLDVWSMGIVLFRLWNGGGEASWAKNHDENNHPIPIEVIYQKIQNLTQEEINREIQRSPRIPEPVKGLLLRMLCVDIGKRASAEELLQDPYIRSLRSVAPSSQLLPFLFGKKGKTSAPEEKKQEESPHKK